MLKRILKNQKGITLVELLAVIVILGIIALIAVPAIANVIEDSRYDSVKSTAINMIESAELYATTNDVEDGTVSLSDLENTDSGSGYIDISGYAASGVNVDVSSTPLTINGTISDDGNNVAIEFSNATVQDINSMNASELRNGNASGNVTQASTD